MSTPASPPSPTTDPMAAAGGDLLRGAAGPGYTREWALFADYTTATDQPTLPTTVDALVGFLRALPAAPTTTARRIRAIAAAHRRAGHLLARPHTGPAAPATRPRRPGRPDPGALLAACPTRGWPHGLPGRRDAFLLVLTDHLELTHHEAREIAPAEIAEHPGEDGEPVLTVRGQVVPSSENPRSCAACAVVRWLDVLSDLDGLGRGSARATLTAAHAPTANSPHCHQPARPARWRAAAQLLPAIDQHGWHDDYRPMTPRGIRARLAGVVRRAEHGGPEVDPHPAVPADGDRRSPHPRPTARDLEEVLGVLDELADDADALNARIQALLEGA